MSPFEVVEFAVVVSTIPLNLVLAIALQRALLRRMSAERRARAWPEDEQLARLLTFGLPPFLSMIPFCVVTRTHAGAGPMALGITKGVLWTLVLVGIFLVYSEGLSLVLEASDPRLAPALALRWR